MVGVQAGSSVLIVGDIAVRLEGDLSMAGLLCSVASNANDAVARLKTTAFPVVVVPPVLVDMTGVDFIHGVLRHFDANVVLYGNGVELNEINALIRTGRVAHFPGHADGHTIADFLTRRTGTPAPVPAPARAAPSLAGAIPGLPTPAPLPSFPPMGSPTMGSLAMGSPTMGSPTLGSPTMGGNISSLFGPPGAPSSPLSSFPEGPSGPLPAAPGGLATFPPKAAGRGLTPAAGFATPGSGHLPNRGATPAPSWPLVDQGALAQLQADARLNQQRMEAMADDLARTNAELVTVRNQLAAAEQERAALLVEVEAARRSSMAQVAEVMALSDEGDPVAEELEEIKQQLQQAWTESDQLRGERDRLVADIAARASALAETRGRLEVAEMAIVEAREQAEQARSELSATGIELEQARLDVERLQTEALAGRGEADEVRLERNSLMAELETVRAERDVIRGEFDATRAELSTSRAAAEEARRGLEKRLADAERATQGTSATEAALRIEVERLKADVGAARTDATTVRLDLQEALMRLDELTQTQQAVAQERDALRAEAGPLREWSNRIVAEHARLQKELERLRAASNARDGQGDRVRELEAQVARLQAQRTNGAGAGDGDAEVTLARSRQLAELVRALEPFMWGLTQAAGFYTKQAVPGGEQHLRLLQQLQGVLLRLRDEIAMLDLS